MALKDHEYEITIQAWFSIIINDNHSRLVSARKKRLFIVCFMVIWIATAALIATSTLCTKSENWNLYRVDNSKKEKILAAIIALLMHWYCSILQFLWTFLSSEYKVVVWFIETIKSTSGIHSGCLFPHTNCLYILSFSV